NVEVGSSHLTNVYFLFSSRRRHTRSKRDWSSDVCSSDLGNELKPSNEYEMVTLLGQSPHQRLLPPPLLPLPPHHQRRLLYEEKRSEERRVGKAVESSARCAWSTQNAA